MSNALNSIPPQTPRQRATSDAANTEAQAENEAYQRAKNASDALIVNVGGPNMPIFVPANAGAGYVAGNNAASRVSAAHRSAVNAHIDAAYQRAAINAKINLNAQSNTNTPSPATSPPSTAQPVGVAPSVATDLQTNP